MNKVADHVRKAHGVHTNTQTIGGYVRGKVRQT